MPPDLESLFREYSGMVFRLCLRYMGDRAEAEDLTQEIFLKVNSTLSGFRGESSHGTWIYRIAANTCLDHLRMHKRRSALAENHYNRYVFENLSAAGDRELARIDLEKILDEVNPDIRQILFLSLAEGLSHEETGRIMGKSTAAVAKAISRFRQSMAGKLASEEGRKNRAWGGKVRFWGGKSSKWT